MMAVAGPVLVALAAIGALLLFMALVRRQAEAAGWSSELQRKLVHVATGLFAMALPFLFAQDWPIWLILALTSGVMVAMRLPMFQHSGASAALHSVERKSWGDFLLAAGVALVFLLSQRDPLLYVLPLAVLTLGDAAAALAGSRYGRRFFVVEDGQKSFEGSTILFLVAMILSMTCLLLLSQIPRENVVLLALLISGFATMVEADSWRGFDNLFLPVAVLIILREHGDSSPGSLILLTVVFAVAFVLFHTLAHRFGLKAHIARVYLAACFMLLSITATQNVVFPLAMLLLHLLAERRNPGRDRHPELDAVAALALLSFGWLAAGNATGLNALDFFGATMAGLCIALSGLVLEGQAGRLQAVVLAALAVAALPIWSILLSLNAHEKHWMPHEAPMMMATLTLCAVVSALMPAAFRSYRMARLSVLAATPPVLFFAYFALGGQT